MYTCARPCSQGLATWQPQVELERLRCVLGARSSSVPRVELRLGPRVHGRLASQPWCQLHGSPRARLDVDVLRRPRWRWRPAHSDTASRFARASSRVSTHLAETHWTRVGSDSRRGGRCRAPAAQSAALLTAERRASAALAALPRRSHGAPQRYPLRYPLRSQRHRGALQRSPARPPASAALPHTGTGAERRGAPR